jgi:hypothetical protein
MRSFINFSFAARGEWGPSIIRALLCALLLPAGAGLAQEYLASSGEVGTQSEDVVQYPAGPLLRAAPEYSQWTITYTYSQDRPAKAAGSSGAAPTPLPESMKGLLLRPRTVVTTKTGAIMRIVSVNLAGTSVEKWIAHDAQYTKPAGSAVWFAASNSERPDDRNAFLSAPLPASGFQDLEWINDRNYAGTVQVGNAQCLVFAPGGLDQEDFKDPGKQKAKLAGKPKVAYIDAITRLPVAMRLPGELRQFQFSDPPPSVMLALPPDLLAQIQKYQAGVARLLEPAGRPY